MRDYATEFREFDKEFGTEAQCRAYLFGLRWSEGFRCPECGYDKAWELNEIKYKCKRCRKQTSLIAGTIFQGTHRPLFCWFRAIWYVQAGGTDVGEMQWIAQLGSNNTALKWLRKLRQIMLNSEQYRQNGKIAFDEFLQIAIDSKPI